MESSCRQTLDNAIPLDLVGFVMGFLGCGSLGDPTRISHVRLIKDNHITSRGNRGNRDPLSVLELHLPKSMEGPLFPQLRPLHVGWRSFPNIGEIGEIGTLPCFPQCADMGNRGNRDPLMSFNSVRFVSI